MPSRDEHLAQARHNEALVAQLRELPGDPYRDWCATALFYSAVHRVEAYLATRGRHSSDHQERNLLVRMERTLSPISRNYRSLLDASRIARYRRDWERLDLDALESNVRAIRTHLGY